MRYFYFHAGQVLGPLAKEELQRLIECRELPQDVQCCIEGEEVWTEFTPSPQTEKNDFSSPPPLPEFKKCPFCAEEVRTEAKLCKHCGSSLVAPSQNFIQKTRSEQVRLSKLPDGKFNCPKCSSSKTVCKKNVGCAVIVIIFVSFGIGLIMLPFLPYTCSCEACGNKWKS